MLIKCKPLMEEWDKILKRETIINLIHGKYSKDFNYQRFEV
jgi:hypothetical protein